jgi:hypothetical protein
LQDLDRRQNEVLGRLEELNQQIDQTILAIQEMLRGDVGHSHPAVQVPRFADGSQQPQTQ